MYYWKSLKHIDEKLVSKTINSIRIKYNFKKFKGEKYSFWGVYKTLIKEKRRVWKVATRFLIRRKEMGKGLGGQGNLVISWHTIYESSYRTYITVSVSLYIHVNCI